MGRDPDCVSFVGREFIICTRAGYPEDEAASLEAFRLALVALARYTSVYESVSNNPPLLGTDSPKPPNSSLARTFPVTRGRTVN